MGANQRQLKNRIRSVRSTMHITKAMQLVASSKMKRAATIRERSSAYANAMREAFGRLGKEGNPIYFTGKKDAPTALIVIAGDRGLAGGYNNNIFKIAADMAEGARLVPIGARAVDHYTRRGGDLLLSYRSVEDVTPADCYEIASHLFALYREGEIGRICVVYTAYRSMLLQEPISEVLLPLTPKANDGTQDFTLYEPSAGAVLAALIPEYLSSLLFGAVKEAHHSELAARHNAMDAATQNAEEMIDTLSLAYNRARQGAITQEITEIVGGAAAED